jgi:hypothetical protein
MLVRTIGTVDPFFPSGSLRFRSDKRFFEFDLYSNRPAGRSAVNELGIVVSEELEY